MAAVFRCGLLALGAVAVRDDGRTRLLNLARNLSFEQWGGVDGAPSTAMAAPGSRSAAR